MKKKNTILGAVAFLAALTVSQAGNDIIFANDFEPIGKNVFISGHSLMDNPYAEDIALMAAAHNFAYNWNQQIGIGSPIRVRTSGNASPPNNWQGYHQGKNRDTFDMDVVAELANPSTIGNNNKYDALLITERHDLFDTILWEYTNSLLRHYHDRLLTANPQAETLFYHSWLPILASEPQVWIDEENLMQNVWECVAEKVNLTLLSDGLAAHVRVVPAGTALTDLLTRILNDEVPGFSGTDLQKIDQLFDDDVHLNRAGIFYMAAVSYATLFKSSPVGTPIPVDIDTATGNALLQIAWDNVSPYLSNYTPKTMSQCRSIIENQICDSYYNFTDRPEQIANCKIWISNNSTWQTNPFNWPDANLITWGAP